MFRDLTVVMLCMAILPVLIVSAESGADIDAQAVLRRSDAARNGWLSYLVRIKITTFEKGKQEEEHLYEVSQKGSEKTHVAFLSPREKGQYLLMLGDDMWIFLPDTRRPIRITPIERLSGDASTGDLARTHYANDYNASYVRSEKVGLTECHVLELSANGKGSTYRRIIYWVRAADARPVKADYFLVSGKHVKSATFDEFTSVEGRTMLARMTIYDQIRKTSHTVLEFSGYSPRKFPDKLFNQERLDRF
jgi:outer membrane lipoprotein-sorting protein